MSFSVQFGSNCSAFLALFISIHLQPYCRYYADCRYGMCELLLSCVIAISNMTTLDIFKMSAPSVKLFFVNRIDYKVVMANENDYNE